MKRLLILIIPLFFVNAQSLSSTSKLFVPLQRSFDILLSSNSFNSAKIEDSFGFDLGISHQIVQFPKFDDFLHIDNKKVDVINLRTIRASVDLPIYIQVGMHINLPSFQMRDFDTNLLGYFAKIQIDQFISDYLPNTSLQFNSSHISLGTFFSSKTDSYQLQFSSKVLFLNFYAGMMMNYNETEFNFQETEKALFNDTRREFYYRAGITAELFFLNIYAESTINQEMDYKNLTVGISIKI